MAQPLPRLRMNLDFMPSPIEDRPGLLIRDSYGYSDAILIVPPPLIQCLECFDGEQTELDLRQRLVQLTGNLDVSGIQQNLLDTLNQAGFLHNDLFEELREARHREFAEAAVREPAHAGTAYPTDGPSARSTLAEYMLNGDPSEDEGLIAIAAPHVSPFGGWQTYKAAYSALGDAHKDRTFIVLGTSHYGQQGRFGLTRKRFVTPLGTAVPDLKLIDELGSEPAAVNEDYCHAVEHSIEFQILFLQHIFGADIRVVPVLCGSFGKGTPEDDDAVRSFLNKLGEINAREGKKLLWVLGIDMAHMGRRYGDPFDARADEGLMNGVGEKDHRRIDRIINGDASGFWSLVRENQDDDDLKWCGSSATYTFLRAVPGTRGVRKGYEQWNIDERSVVSFAALSFRR